MVKSYYIYGCSVYYICGQILLHLWFVDLLHLWLKVITFMVSITFMVGITFMVFITFMGDVYNEYRHHRDNPSMLRIVSSYFIYKCTFE